MRHRVYHESINHRWLVRLQRIEGGLGPRSNPLFSGSARFLSFGVALLVALFARPMAGASSLETFHDCKLVPTDWADGDSFRVSLPNGEERTIRLYGADCLEWHVTDNSDARRLSEQRRYFGITEVESSSEKSIEVAKQLGQAAGQEVSAILSKPFAIHTAFADARGDARYQRIYAFVTTAEGKDLASLLVSKGLARAFGVYRETPAGQQRDEYRARLADLELQAAKRGAGAWKYTDWESLPLERQAQREDDEETALALAPSRLPPGTRINPNTAARDQLMLLDGVGEVLANRIIEGRPYASIDDLSRVSGIGPKTLERLTPNMSLSSP